MYTLIVGGDSFTAHSGCWPDVVTQKNNFRLLNTAVPSAGNDHTLRCLVHAIYKTLNDGVVSTDILVAPMWTYPTRKSFFVNQQETLMWTELVNSNKTRIYSVNPTSFIERQFNNNHNSINLLGITNNYMLSEVKDSGWVIGESKTYGPIDSIGNYKLPYLKNYFTHEGVIIETLENMIYLQSFCKSLGIKLINLCYSFNSIFYYPTYYVHEKDNIGAKHILESYEKNCSHLYNFIEFTNWVTPGLLDYCYINNLKFNDSTHPSPEAHDLYVQNIIQPQLEKLI